MPVGIMKLKGADGTVYTVPALKGDACMWFNGTAVTGTGTGIAATVTGSKQYDMYINTTTKRIYQATSANTWDYKFTITMRNDARIVVGNSNAGYAADQCDFLCDGTDDQTEINAAIAALPATGGKVVLLDGAYNITANITVNKANVELCGTTASQLTFANTNSAINISITTDNCTVHDLTLIGSQTANNRNVIEATSCNRLQFYNLQVSKGQIGVASCGNVILTKNIIGKDNGYNYGIYVSGTSHDIVISNNDLSGSYSCVAVTGAQRVTITNNTARLSNDVGVSLQGATDIVVANNNFYTDTGGGIVAVYCSVGTRISITGNCFHLNETTQDGYQVIVLCTTNYCIINNNIIRTASTSVPINIQSDCNGITLMDNGVCCASAQIWATTSATNFVIDNNQRWPK